MSANDGATTARKPKSCSAHTACSREEPQPKLRPLTRIGRPGSSSGAGLVELPAISSTEVRKRVAAGHSAVPLVPASVMDYIAGRGLYS